MATVNEKILNALNEYNQGLKVKLDSRFIKQTDSDTFVTKVAGKDLSTNDFTDGYKAKIDSIETTYAKKSDVVGVYKYKGTVSDYASIPSDTTVGDVWNISIGGGVDENGVAIKAGDNVAITDTGADVLAGSVDLSAYTRIYVGSVAPTDTAVIWLDTSGYST